MNMSLIGGFMIDERNKKNILITEYQRKILEDINSSERRNLYDLNFSLDEFLAKDENGITFLEHLIRKKIYVDKEFLKDSLDAAYIFCECDENLYGFNLEEEDLFSNYNGIRFIDYLAKNNKLTFDIVKSIKNHVEIVDILIEKKSMYLLDKLDEKIVNQLIKEDLNGNYYIEKYFDNNVVMRNLIPIINNPKKLIQILDKNNKSELLEFANTDILMYELKDNYTVLNDLLKKNIVPDNLKKIPSDRNFINYLRKNNIYDYFYSCSESIFLIKFDNDKTLLEEIIEKSNITEIKGSIKNEKTIKILYENNKLNLAVNVDEDLLIKPISLFDSNTKFGNQTLFEYMLDQDYDPLLKVNRISNEAIINILYSREKYNILGKKLNEKGLQLQMKDGVFLIDKLLENNIKIEYSSFSSDKLLKKFYEKGRVDLLANARLDKLFEFVNKDDAYIDFVLEAIKSKQIKFNLSNVYFFGYEVNLVAKFYLALAKHNMMEYVKELESSDLLKKYEGKVLLDELLDVDPEITIKRIIPEKVKNEMAIAIILKSRGLVQDNIDVADNNSGYNYEYLKTNNNRLGIGPFKKEGEELLKKLQELFLSDGKSDPELIETLIIGYRNALLVDYNIYINELRKLVETKEKNMKKFVYLRNDEKAYFKPVTGAVYAYNNVVDTLMHETGHALHSYLVDEKIPYECNYIIERARNNPEMLKKVEKYAKKYNEIREKITTKVEEESKVFFSTYFTPEKIKEIENNLSLSEEDKKEKFKSLGILEEFLNVILKELFTVEQYINHQKRIYVKEKVDAIFRSKYGSLMAIGDILDAIYEGELHSGFLKNEKGDKIPKTAGHGISYYYDSTGKAFSEMVANFSSISKSTNAHEMLDLLKSIIGDELYNTLSTFYYENIANVNEDQIQSSKKI